MTTRLLVLDGGAPWGFRMHGGLDCEQTLRITRVNPGSKAATSGVREGDIITSINSHSTRELTNAEAHALLRNAGDTLRLGLNEDSSGSPSRKQFKTIHHETRQEIIKRSSVTIYSVKNTEDIVQSKKYDGVISKDNENIISGTSKNNPPTTVISQRPTLASSSSTSSSSASTLKEDLKNTSTDNALASQRSSYTNCTVSPTNSVFSEDAEKTMNENASTSKSKRRRQRRKNKKQSEPSDNTRDPQNCDNKDVTASKTEYLVHSPKELCNNAKKNSKPVKSKSLGDDDMIKIQELSEVSEMDDKDKQSQAIISEAESEVEWEDTSCLNTLPPLHGTLSTLTLPIENSYITEQVTLISPEEEETLRNFLHDLNLVNGPEEAAKQIYEKISAEDLRRRKARKRAQLEQYFLPIAQNPRYLDVISEEASDRDSDREQKTKNLKQGTPELEIPPKVPPRSNRDKRRTIPKSFAAPIPQAPAILVDTKIVENNNIYEGICSTTKSEEATSIVEIVFLDESTNSNSPEDLTSSNSDSYILASSSEEISTGSLDSTKLKTVNTSDPEINSNVTDNVVQSTTDLNFTIKNEDLKNNNLMFSQLTPPPTPDDISPKNGMTGPELERDGVCAVFVDKDERRETNNGAAEPLENSSNQFNATLVELDNMKSLASSNNTPINEIESKYPIDNSNITPPPPPSRSTSSSNSSSRSSSRCTTKYIPTVSSLTDICSLNEEVYHHPLTLREMCLKFLITLPFGKDILLELADISEALESLPFSQLAQLANSSSRKVVNNISSEVSVTKSAKRVETEEERLRRNKNSSDKSTKNVLYSMNEINKIPPEVPVRRYKHINSRGRNSWMENIETKETISDSSSKLESTATEKKFLERVIPVNKYYILHEKQRNIPVNKEWLENSAMQLERLNNIRDIRSKSKDYAKRLNEVDVYREVQNLEDSENITKKRLIPITKNVSHSQKELQSERIESEMKIINKPIHKDWPEQKSEIDESTFELLKKEDSAKELIIPIEKEWLKQKDSFGNQINKNLFEPISSSKADSLDTNKEKNKEIQISIKIDCSNNKNESSSSTLQSKKHEKYFQDYMTRNEESLGIQIHNNWKLESSKTHNEKGKVHIVPVTVTNINTTEETSSNLLSKEQQNNKAIFSHIHSKDTPGNSGVERIIPISKACNKSLFVHDEVNKGSLNTPIYQQWSDPRATGDITPPIEIKSTEIRIPVTTESESKVEIPIGLEDLITMPSRSREVTIPIRKDWVAMPTETDPNVLVCLSPKQKEELEKKEKVPNEPEKLLDLHEKFVNRIIREHIRKSQEEKVTLTNVQVPTTNRLLGIIKEEPSFGMSAEDTAYLYFVDKAPKTASTLSRNLTDARLRAKDLSEWLNLARNKSMSESNLSTAPGVPENNLRDICNTQPTLHRRKSLPYDLFERQMTYLQEKGREVQKQLEELEEEKRRISADMAHAKEFNAEDYNFSRQGDFAESKSRPTSMPAVPTEFFRQQMYEEFMDQIQAREERKQQKVIKVSSSKNLNQENKKSYKEIIHPVQLEEEFMDKVKQKQKEGKLETIKSTDKEGSSEKELNEDEPVLVMEGDNFKENKKLPRHLQEFVDITKQSAQQDGIWSPGQKQESRDSSTKLRYFQDQKTSQDEAIQPIWTPKSATTSPTVERKEFKPVNFQSPVLTRKNRTKSENFEPENLSSGPSRQIPGYSSDTGIASSFEKRITTSHSSPASGFGNLSTSSRLPKAQNPTITLLQKAREGQMSRGPVYIEEQQKPFRSKDERAPIVNPGEVFYQLKNQYISQSDSEQPRKMDDLGPPQFEGIGPVSKDGMPLILRSEVKDQNQSKWYKRMYDTIHKQKPHNDEYVTVRYKQKRAQYPYSSGYLSEPEPGAYDSDFTEYRYQTLDSKRPIQQEKHSDYVTSTMPRNITISSRSSSSELLRAQQGQYNVQRGRIENYTTGHSSISEKEAKEHLEQHKRYPPAQKSFINQALKESGYESDSTLVFRRREEAAQQQLSPKEQREAYKHIQKGGDVPLHGLRKPAPERPKESPRKYVENEVTIHYKTPVRQEIKDYISEDELAYRQAENMKKIYQEERRKKYLQELQDLNSRRHMDNFIPSQKSPISLNRYDDFDDLAPALEPQPRSTEPRLVARALYNFVGQTARELTFRKGELIYVRRQVDKNWYEGELNAMVGLFPTNYVEIVPYDGMKTTPRKSHEGQARAKYNFVSQTHLELSLAKGELVVITRKVDDNWFEGKIGGRKGIFPASYVEVLIDPHNPPQASTKPVAAPAAHSLLLNGSSGGKESMGAHCYTPTASFQSRPSVPGSLSRIRPSVDEALHIETQSEPVAYRALYKYLPQNDDELELLEGDTVYVLEKCDDGWYVGSSNRTGAFGTFPGNYVEKV